MKRRGLTGLFTLLAAAASLVAVPAVAGPRVGTLATELARLRGEVDELARRVEGIKADSRARLRSLGGQRAELEMQLSRETLRLEHLRKRQRRLDAKRAQRSEAKARLLPLVREVAALVAAEVDHGLPFRRVERKRAIESIVEQAERKRLPADEALGRLWAQVEDELRLGRESGLYRQVIELDGKQQLVEVARVGMVMLYFRARDGRVGRARRKGEGWRYELIDEPEDGALVRGLFEAFRKQIRTGFFALPAAIVRQGGPR